MFSDVQIGSRSLTKSYSMQEFWRYRYLHDELDTSHHLRRPTVANLKKFRKVIVENLIRQVPEVHWKFITNSKVFTHWRSGWGHPASAQIDAVAARDWLM